MCLEQTRTATVTCSQATAVALLQGEYGHPLPGSTAEMRGTLRARLPLLELRLRDAFFQSGWVSEAMAAYKRHQK